jgi:hypothetical protein
MIGPEKEIVSKDRLTEVVVSSEKKTTRTSYHLQDSGCNIGSIYQLGFPPI